MKYLSLIFILFFSCVNTKSHREIMLDKFKEKVSLDVFESLPINDTIIKNSLYQNIIFPESIYTSNYCGLFIEYEYNADDYDRFYKKIKEKSLFESKIVDSCNVFIPLQKPKKKCQKTNPPVPNINDDFNGLKSKIKGDEKYIVTNYKKGVYLKNKLLLNNGNSHGFSNGVVITKSSKRIIYWLIVW